MLSFVTPSEMEITTVAAERSRSVRGELSRARPVAKDTDADIVCFAEFVIHMLLAPMAH